MPGLHQVYHYRGKNGIRRTPYRYAAIHELDWYDLHRLADRFRISMVDTLHLLISKNLESFGLEPTGSLPPTDVEEQVPKG